MQDYLGLRVAYTLPATLHLPTYTPYLLALW